MTEIDTILYFTGGYLLLLLGAIVWSRYAQTSKILPGMNEYFLASRSLSTPVMMLTFMGTLLSTFTVVGMPGSVYTNGLGTVGFVVMIDLVIILMIVSYGNVLRKYAKENDLFSPIECISHAYKSKSLSILISAIFIVTIIPYISLQLVGTGKLLEGLSGGDIGYVNGVGFMMVIVAIYLLLGGMRAVAYTDFVQGLVAMGGLMIGAFVFVQYNWGGLGALFEQAYEQQPDMLSLPGPSGFYTAPMFVSYSIFFGMLFFQPQLMTRMIMAKDKKQINSIAIAMILAMLLIYKLPMLFGVGAKILNPELTEANQTMGYIFNNIASAGILGLIATTMILMGTIGAAMSTADSMLLALGKLFTRDIIRKFFEIDRKKQVLFAKLIMLTILIIAFIIGLNPPKVMIDLAIGSVAWTAIMAPAMIGFTWKKRNLTAALSSIIISGILLAFLMATSIKPLGFHEGFVCMILSCIVYLACCFIFKLKAVQT